MPQTIESDQLFHRFFQMCEKKQKLMYLDPNHSLSGIMAKSKKKPAQSSLQWKMSLNA